jgi:hypothetical protein
MKLNGLNIKLEDGLYHLQENYIFTVSHYNKYYKDDIVELDKDGVVTVFPGFVSDGATGALDTLDFLVGFFKHDVAYYLIRNGVLPKSYRAQADKQLYIDCREAGMPWWRREYVYWAVRLFGRYCI